MSVTEETSQSLEGSGQILGGREVPVADRLVEGTGVVEGG